MKKLKYLILALALIPSVLFAYTVQQGDTPYELWGADWKTELSKYGIQDPRRLPVGLEVDLEDDIFGAVILPEDSYDTFLTAPLSTSATEVFVNVTPSFVSSSIYTLFASDGRTVREKLYCTGTSASPNKLTGCVRGLSEGPVSGVIDETAGTGVSHSRNARIAITDNINFSGKALSILGGNQPTGGNNFDLGTASSTDGNKCFRFDTGDTDTQICANDGTGQLYWTTDGGSNTYLFTSSSISQLVASSTQGIQVTSGAIGINASSTTGGAFDSNGAYYQAIGNALEYTNNAVGVSTSTIVEQIATSTPTAGKIPIANASSTLDSWVTNYVFGDGSDGNVTISSGTTTLTRDMHYDNLTIDTGGVINANGYKIFVKNTLTGASTTSKIVNNGNSASLQTGGAETTRGSLGIGTLGATGIDTGNANGPSNTTGGLLSSRGARGGVGGNAGSGGGVGGSAGTIVTTTQARIPMLLVTGLDYYSTSTILKVTGGTGGGAGASASGAGPGGGGGGGGGVVGLFAKSITGFLTLEAKGGVGGSATANSAKGGGGGGGHIVIVSRTNTATIATDVTGGAGGATGSGSPGTGSTGNVSQFSI
jgi:hypothetical protein